MIIILYHTVLKIQYFFVIITLNCRIVRKIRNVFPPVVPLVLHTVTTNDTMLNTTESQETYVLINLNDISGDIRFIGLRFNPYWGENICLHHIKVKRTSTGVCKCVHSTFNSTCESVVHKLPYSGCFYWSGSTRQASTVFNRYFKTAVTQ